MKKALKKKTLVVRTKKAANKVRATNKEFFFVVGIGASAGGLDPIKTFFDNTTSNSGLAYVIVQHLDPTHKSILSELIAGHTKMDVLEITDGLKLKPNTVYVIPPNKDLELIKGTLQLTIPKEPRSSRRSIDTFFKSLAKDQGDKAIGIVLSGTGTEGTFGLKAIREEGGLTLAQDLKTAQFEGMPQSAILGNVVDLVLAPEKMPEQLLKYIAKNKSGLKKIAEIPSVISNTDLNKIYLIIRNQTGYDFSNYKTSTIIRRIAKRMAINQNNSIEDYIDVLQKNTDEIEKLYKDFFIGVTTFFRDEQVFVSIKKKVIPHLLSRCIEKQEMRIWVCGCSTGEEAYSYAILLREALEKLNKYIKVIIFASDIDKEAINQAREGIYAESSLVNVSAGLLAKYFVAKEFGYQIKKEIREMLVFAHHSVIKDPPFSKMDMISCRNLLIYMNADLQKKIIPIFHYSLNRDGILILGSSESLGSFSNNFSNFDSKVKIFQKKSESSAIRKSRMEYELPIVQRQPIVSTIASSIEAKKKINLAGLVDKTLLNYYSHPSVVIDKNNDALFFSGDTKEFLAPPIGEARMNIIEMAKKGLKLNLNEAILKARSEQFEVRLNNLILKEGNLQQCINLIVKPLFIKEIDPGVLIVIFESVEKTKDIISENKRNLISKKTNLIELENELRISREHLQSAINELESSNDNLQTTNEEYQSSNEELQSTNEELETSREELQSVNEELITVNSELTSKIDQLSQANDDLSNLLSSIDVATIFLDRDLKIIRFTPSATKIFNLIQSDIDRPVTHLTGNIVYKNLVDDVNQVLKKLQVKTADVRANDGTYYHMRILPYRTTENMIEGVLVTFVDITEQKNTEEKLKKTNEHLNLVMENLPAVPFTFAIDHGINISFVGKSCEKVTGFMAEQFMNKSSFWVTRIHPDDKKKLLAGFSVVIKKGIIDIPFRWKCSNGKYKNFVNYMRHAEATNGRPAYIIGVWKEMTDKKTLKK